MDLYESVQKSSTNNEPILYNNGWSPKDIFLFFLFFILVFFFFALVSICSKFCCIKSKPNLNSGQNLGSYPTGFNNGLGVVCVHGGQPFSGFANSGNGSNTCCLNSSSGHSFGGQPIGENNDSGRVGILSGHPYSSFCHGRSEWFTCNPNSSSGHSFGGHLLGENNGLGIHSGHPYSNGYPTGFNNGLSVVGVHAGQPHTGFGHNTQQCHTNNPNISSGHNETLGGVPHSGSNGSAGDIKDAPPSYDTVTGGINSCDQGGVGSGNCG